MRVGAVVTGGAVLMICVVLGAGAGILVPVLAAVRLLMHRRGPGRLVVNLAVSNGAHHRLGGRCGVGDQEE